MATIFVSRHPGAIEWMKHQPIHVDRWLMHLQIEEVKPKDVVIGNLPIHLACQICELGARFFSLEIAMPLEKRGMELKAQDLKVMNCAMKEYVIRRR